MPQFSILNLMWFNCEIVTFPLIYRFLIFAFFLSFKTSDPICPFVSNHFTKEVKYFCVALSFYTVCKLPLTYIKPAYPIIRLYCGTIVEYSAICPDVIVLVFSCRVPTKLEPVMLVTCMVRYEIHNQLQVCDKQNIPYNLITQS